MVPENYLGGRGRKGRREGGRGGGLKEEGRGSSIGAEYVWLGRGRVAGGGRESTKKERGKTIITRHESKKSK